MMIRLLLIIFFTVLQFSFCFSIETLEPDVKILSLTILCPGRPDIVLQIPEDGDPKGVWFTLKEGTHYHLRFSIKVSNNIVSGLRYTNTVWKTGLKVDSSKEMLGTFSPQPEPYIHEMPEETTPSGYFARGSYAAKSRVSDSPVLHYLFVVLQFQCTQKVDDLEKSSSFV
ncbi:rho GDP-dissociation inhibitor 1-like [Rhododendron vialii]|uniref:rho GDP-dissociation inhibitor 1-like n=1 Tax=Rhododendron vialii TaxID=182163 RepID=UPI00265F4DE7|nr:rho GDP-dissociation inhibitor 1-like [Rhododendron vialii]